MELISKIITQIKKLKKHPELLLLCVVLDAIFFVLYGFLTSPFFKSMETSLAIISDKVALELDLISQGQSASGGIIDILFSPHVFGDLASFVLTGFAVIALIYLLYCTLHGLNWKYAKQISNEHEDKYLKKFFKVNILWFVLLSAHAIIDILQELRYRIISRVAGPGINYPRYLMFAVLVCLIYFMLVSYKTGKIKNVLSAGLNKENLISFGLLILLFVIINYILMFTLNLSASLGFIVGVVLFLPAVTYARVLFLETKRNKISA